MAFPTEQRKIVSHACVPSLHAQQPSAYELNPSAWPQPLDGVVLWVWEQGNVTPRLHFRGSGGRTRHHRNACRTRTGQRRHRRRPPSSINGFQHGRLDRNRSTHPHLHCAVPTLTFRKLGQQHGLGEAECRVRSHHAYSRFNAWVSSSASARHVKEYLLYGMVEDWQCKRMRYC